MLVLSLAGGRPRRLPATEATVTIAAMRIVSVDPIYLKVPHVTRAADGTQDTLLVRIGTDEGIVGWGECDASPLVSLAAYCCPMSHGNIINIRQSLMDERLDGPDDIHRLRAKVMRQGLDIQQLPHAYSGADIALWDALGKKRGHTVCQLVSGALAFHRKRPYASVLFGDTPEQTHHIAQGLVKRGFRAAKFGWGPLGSRDAAFDEALVRAARDGLGDDASLMIDAGVAWGDDIETVLERARRFAKYNPIWLEEPLHPEAIGAYGRLASGRPAVPIAAGENCGTIRAAEDYLQHAGLSFIQIDAGRIGGITPARTVCELARRARQTYVNHTFKSHLSLAAAIHVFADVEAFGWLEYPAGGSRLSNELVSNPLMPDAQGLVAAPDGPGLGVEINLDIVREFFVPVRIEVAGQTVFESEAL